MKLTRILPALALTGALFGCNQSAEKALIFPDADGYVEFVNRDSAPSTIFHVRELKQVTVVDGIFHATKKDGREFLIPKHRVIYAGREIK